METKYIFGLLLLISVIANIIFLISLFPSDKQVYVTPLETCTLDSDCETGNVCKQSILCKKGSDNCVSAKYCQSEVSVVSCGNSVCESGEDCSSCSSDCGVCGSGPVCGNGICEKGETTPFCLAQDCGSPCPEDCDGNERKIDEVSLSCNSDNDCFLRDNDLGFGCCWTGACKSIDYSLDNYIAVNKESFIELRSLSCPIGDLWSAHTSEEKTLKYQTCGPAPGCPNKITNIDFIARCINNVCEKIPKGDSTCGNGVCEEAEDENNCSIDCPLQWDYVISGVTPVCNSYSPNCEEGIKRRVSCSEAEKDNICNYNLPSGCQPLICRIPYSGPLPA